MAEVKLPAVSGSSDRLIISPSKDDAAERSWPGQVFEDPALDYTAAMQAFVAALLPDAQPATPTESPSQAEKASRRDQKRQLRQRHSPYARRGVKRANSAKLKIRCGARYGSNDAIQIVPTKPGGTTALNAKQTLSSANKPT